jgi:hypothetical protein
MMHVAGITLRAGVRTTEHARHHVDFFYEVFEEHLPPWWLYSGMLIISVDT